MPRENSAGRISFRPLDDLFEPTVEQPKLCQAVRLSPGADASEKLLRIAQGFTEAFASLWLSLHPLDLLLGVAGAALVRLAVYLKAKNAKKYRRGVEYGSAR